MYYVDVNQFSFHHPLSVFSQHVQYFGVEWMVSNRFNKGTTIYFAELSPLVTPKILDCYLRLCMFVKVADWLTHVIISPSCIDQCS